MTTITVKASRTYDVTVGKGLLDTVGTRLAALLPPPRTVMLISDDCVFPLYGASTKASLEAAGYTVSTFVFKNGEASKNTATLAATGILLARVLDEPLLFDLYGVEPKNDLRIVAGRRPALYLTSADGTLRAVAISEEGGVRFSVVCGEALPSDYEDALYPTK
jgi:hypothetical protein